MRIPASALAPETLRAVVEEFVSREGTDYGEVTYSLEQKVSAVMLQLADGTAAIEFDEANESVTIVPVRV